MIWLCSLFQLHDTLDAVDEGTDAVSDRDCDRGGSTSEELKQIANG